MTMTTYFWRRFSSHVFFVRFGYKMSQPNTRRVVAKMTNLQVRRHLAISLHVNESMSELGNPRRLVAKVEVAVTPRGYGTSPFQTPTKLKGMQLSALSLFPKSQWQNKLNQLVGTFPCNSWCPDCNTSFSCSLCLASQREDRGRTSELHYHQTAEDYP